jgi:hypothetical protein
VQPTSQQPRQGVLLPLQQAMPVLKLQALVQVCHRQEYQPRPQGCLGCLWQDWQGWQQRHTLQASALARGSQVMQVGGSRGVAMVQGEAGSG